MNVFNRAVVIVEILLLIVALIVAAVVPNIALERALYTVQQARDLLEARWPTSYLVFLFTAIVLILLLVGLLWLQVRPTAKKSVGVRNISGAQVEVSTASVEQSLQHRLSEVGDVLKVRPTVRGKRGGVGVYIDLETTPEIDVPAKTTEISQIARDVVEGKLGLKVAGIKVHVKHAAYGKVQAPPSAPVEPPSAPVEPISTILPSEPAVTTTPDQPA